VPDRPRPLASNVNYISGQTVPNLVVVDGSAFPTASGVNPMITIEAIAHLNASRLAANLS
jgi:choline dehydrogenase-like flavoprotein